MTAHPFRAEKKAKRNLRSHFIEPCVCHSKCILCLHLCRLTLFLKIKGFNLFIKG